MSHVTHWLHCPNFLKSSSCLVGSALVWFEYRDQVESQKATKTSGAQMLVARPREAAAELVVQRP